MDDKNYKILIDNREMAKPFFSVIMLTYNACEFIDKAINMIYNQTFNDFELVLIDDCSSDDTENIVKTNIDNRLKYIKNNNNKGVGRSRELGISISKGQYIIFVDVDDIIDSNLLLELKKEIDKNNTDYIIYGFEERYVEKHNKELWHKDRLPFDVYVKYINKCNAKNNTYNINNADNKVFIYNKDEINDLLIYLEDATILGYPWNKCYRKQIINDNNIHFEDISIYEDIFFNLEYYKKISSISFLNKIFYTYNNSYNNKSITKKDYDNYFELSKERVKRLHNILKENNKLDINSLSVLNRIYIRYAYSELNRCINRKYNLKQLLKRFDEIRNDELFEKILNEIKKCNSNNQKEKISFNKVMKDSFINKRKLQVFLIVLIINFVNRHMYGLYLKIAK